MALWRNWYGARGFLRASRAPRRPAEPRGESRSVQGAAERRGAPRSAAERPERLRSACGAPLVPVSFVFV